MAYCSLYNRVTVILMMIICKTQVGPEENQYRVLKPGQEVTGLFLQLYIYCRSFFKFKSTFMIQFKFNSFLDYF